MRQPNIYRNFAESHRRLMLDYFWKDFQAGDDGSSELRPVYPDSYLDRRFWMPKTLFRKVFSAIVAESDVLRVVLRPDCTVKLVASPFFNRFCNFELYLLRISGGEFG